MQKRHGMVYMLLQNDLKIEIKSKRTNKNYPKDVIILDESNLQLFLVVI